MRKTIFALIAALAVYCLPAASWAQKVPQKVCSCELCSEPRPPTLPPLDCYATEVGAWGPCPLYLYLYCPLFVPYASLPTDGHPADGIEAGSGMPPAVGGPAPGGPAPGGPAGNSLIPEVSAEVAERPVGSP